MAEGTSRGRHWAFYLYRGRPAPPDPPGERWCDALVDWNPAGRVAGWSVGCGLEQQLRSGRKLTLSLEEPVENEVFVYHGPVTRRAARVRFQIGDQQPFEARLIDLGAQFPANWYIAVFSPKGGTRTMLDRRVRKTVTLLDAAGRTRRLRLRPTLPWPRVAAVRQTLVTRKPLAKPMCHLSPEVPLLCAAGHAR